VRKKKGREKSMIQHKACNNTTTHFLPLNLNFIFSKLPENLPNSSRIVKHCDKNKIYIDENITVEYLQEVFKEICLGLNT